MDWPRILELTLHDLEASFTIQCLCINLLEDRIVELEGLCARIVGPVANKCACRKNHRHPPPPPERATTPLPPPSLPLVTFIPVPSHPPSPTPYYAPSIKAHTIAPEVETAAPVTHTIDPLIAPIKQDRPRVTYHNACPQKRRIEKTQLFNALPFPPSRGR